MQTSLHPARRQKAKTLLFGAVWGCCAALGGSLSMGWARSHCHVGEEDAFLAGFEGRHSGAGVSCWKVGAAPALVLHPCVLNLKG